MIEGTAFFIGMFLSPVVLSTIYLMAHDMAHNGSSYENKWYKIFGIAIWALAWAIVYVI